MKTEDINQIKKLFLLRVRDPEQRAKIIQLASFIAAVDEGLGGKNPQQGGEPSMNAVEEQETDFWSAIYHYSLSENWPEINQDLHEFSGLDTSGIDFF